MLTRALFSLLFLASGPAIAAEAVAVAPGPAATSRLPSASPLDELFAELKRERNEAAAGRIASRIWDVWLRSGSATTDLLMSRANTAIEKKSFPVALDLLDQVVLLQPGFAEARNRRATVHFMMRNFAKSMSDIEATLELEPRHFGALSGMASIMKETGRRELALAAFERTLALYPMMRSAQAEVATLSEELAGQGI